MPAGDGAPEGPAPARWPAWLTGPTGPTRPDRPARAERPGQPWPGGPARRLLALLGLLLGALLSLAATPARAELLVWSAAQVASAAPGQAPDWNGAPMVPLPDDWATTRPQQRGTLGYRLVFDAPTGEATRPLYALHVERACSAMQVRLNGQLLHDDGPLDEPLARNCHRPQLVAVPAALLQPERNELVINLRGYPLSQVSSRSRSGGLSELEFGPYDQVAAHHARHVLFAVRLPEVMSGTLVLMGSFMFVMGWFNRQQSYLAYFGALMVGWSLLLARLWARELPLDNHAAEIALATLMPFITLAGVQFLLRYARERLRWVNRALPAQCLLMPLSLLAVGEDNLYAASGLWFVVLTVEVVVASVHYLVSAHRARSRDQWLMAGMMSVVGVAMVVEFAARTLPLDARIGYVAQLVPALVFMLLGLMLVQQYGRAYQSAEQSRAELEVRVREAAAQIERNFAQLAELKVEQVTDRERKRIAADLHDDLGAKLLTIVHTSESERISTLAREALEEMRLSVKGLTGKPVKLADALADWRVEVVQRLNQSGVQGEWSAPPEEETPQTLSSRAFVQTTRILREAVSNVIKHSGASQCSVRALIADGDFQLVIQDNGQGIPAELEGRLDKGHGMASMKGRAKQLQGQCLVESAPGYGTVIRLTMPLERHVTNS